MYLDPVVERNCVRRICCNTVRGSAHVPEVVATAAARTHPQEFRLEFGAVAGAAGTVRAPPPGCGNWPFVPARKRVRAFRTRTALLRRPLENHRPHGLVCLRRGRGSRLPTAARESGAICQ